MRPESAAGLVELDGRVPSERRCRPLGCRRGRRRCLALGVEAEQLPAAAAPRTAR